MVPHQRNISVSSGDELPIVFKPFSFVLETFVNSVEGVADLINRIHNSTEYFEHATDNQGSTASSLVRSQKSEETSSTRDTTTTAATTPTNTATTTATTTTSGTTSTSTTATTTIPTTQATTPATTTASASSAATRPASTSITTSGKRNTVYPSSKSSVISSSLGERTPAIDETTEFSISDDNHLQRDRTANDTGYDQDYVEDDDTLKPSSDNHITDINSTSPELIRNCLKEVARFNRTHNISVTNDTATTTSTATTSATSCVNNSDGNCVDSEYLSTFKVNATIVLLIFFISLASLLAVTLYSFTRGKKNTAIRRKKHINIYERRNGERTYVRRLSYYN